ATPLLTAQGTPASGQPVVVVARDRPAVDAPPGDQTLRLAGPRDDPPSLDPALARDLSTAMLCRQLFRGLTRLDDDLRPVPELAERIEISADGLHYTFRLRPDARFHDGRTVVAADVVASLTRALTPATAGGDPALLGGPTYLGDIVGADDVVAGNASSLRGARAVDERTVELRLTGPRASFLAKLAGAPAAVIDPADPRRGAEWWRAPNGTGPFRLAAWEPGDRIAFKPHDGYAPGPPAAKIEFRLGPDASQPFNLYQAGEIDVAAVPSFALDRVTDPTGPLEDDLVVTPQLAVAYLAFRTDVSPMDDPHLRRAVALAFPNEKMAEVAAEGHRLVAQGLIPPGTLGRSWPVEPIPHDLVVARREVAASRYGSPEKVPPIRIYGASVAGAAALRDVLAADLGLRVEVVSVEWPEFNDGLHRRHYPAYELYWGADYPDPETFLWALFADGAPDNYIDYRNDAVDAPLHEAGRTLDPVRRAALYERAHQALIDDAAVIPLYHEVRHTLVAPEVRGLEITAMGILGFERVWLDR
ncbi:MAG: peptide ABC transporter substrate-binding protein, partial [Chloroflexota bacterium]|nr:peptide ABC transporter substrate-binding protein [Chloroflexota bacterium]